MVKHDLSDLSTQESKLQLEMRAKSELEEMAKARAALVERQVRSVALLTANLGACRR